MGERKSRILQPVFTLGLIAFCGMFLSACELKIDMESGYRAHDSLTNAMATATLARAHFTRIDEAEALGHLGKAERGMAVVNDSLYIPDEEGNSQQDRFVEGVLRVLGELYASHEAEIAARRAGNFGLLPELQAEQDALEAEFAAGFEDADFDDFEGQYDGEYARTAEDELAAIARYEAAFVERYTPGKPWPIPAWKVRSGATERQSPN